VNDGSTDDTFGKLKTIYGRDPNVYAIVDFFKNAGQSNAATPGILLARGRAIVLIDSDLQLDPEDMPKLIGKYDEGFDIVTGYREERRDSIFRKIPSVIANIIMRKASDSDLRDFGCTFKIFDGRLVRAFKFGPFNPWRPVPVIAMAGRIAEVPVNHHRRKFGKSGWTFKKLFAYNMENMVNLSERPFQILAGLCLLFSVLFALRVLVSPFLHFSILPEITNGLILNVIVIALLATLSALSIIGEFVIRNFVKLQSKPAYVVREILVREKGSKPGEPLTGGS
jgi:glycosyltransferase involved in cell wall biosynthesis